jgi:hypothetical protein
LRMKKISTFLFLLAVAVFVNHTAASAKRDSSSVLPLYMSDAYQEEDVLISFNQAYSKTDSCGSQFCIVLNTKVLAKNKIIKPSRYTYGIYVLDNFGNDLNVISMTPRYCESLRPQEEKLFTITFSIRPLDNTKYLLIQVPTGIFGNINPFELKILNTGLQEATTKEEINRLESGVGFERWEKENTRIDFMPDNIEQKRQAKILYTKIFVGVCVLCSLGLIFFWCLKKAKKTILLNESFLSFLARWAKKNRLHLSIIYILSALISSGWLVFGIILVIAGETGDTFEIMFFLASLALLSILSFWMICEMLNEWRISNN